MVAGSITALPKTAVKVALCSANRILKRFEEKLFILGEGRSGTTWLMNVLNFDDRYRCLIEPFLTQNFERPVGYASEYPFPDAGTGTAVARQVARTLRGDYISATTTLRFPRLLYDGLLIKDVSAHLIIDQIAAQAPQMKKVLILRHPFAVASSKVRAFSWPTRPTALLSADNPACGLLVPQRELIEATERDADPLLVQVLLWCMAFRCAFAAAAMKEFVLVAYEDLVQEPRREIARLFAELGMADRYESNRSQIEAVTDARSHVTRSRNTIGASRAGKATWQETWPRASVARGLDILREFELDFLYGESHGPLIDMQALRDRLPHANIQEGNTDRNV